MPILGLVAVIASINFNTLILDLATVIDSIMLYMPILGLVTLNHF